MGAAAAAAASIVIVAEDSFDSQKAPHAEGELAFFPSSLSLSLSDLLPLPSRYMRALSASPRLCQQHLPPFSAIPAFAQVRRSRGIREAGCGQTLVFFVFPLFFCLFSSHFFEKPFSSSSLSTALPLPPLLRLSSSPTRSIGSSSVSSRSSSSAPASHISGSRVRFSSSVSSSFSKRDGRCSFGRSRGDDRRLRPLPAPLGRPRRDAPRRRGAGRRRLHRADGGPAHGE